MKGNAICPDNREKLNQSIKLLSALKDIKLRARAEKYKEQSADLEDLIAHLKDEVEEMIEARSDYSVNWLSVALEVADISNCCDLIIFELLEILTNLLMSY